MWPIHLIHPLPRCPGLNAKQCPMRVYDNWRENADTVVKQSRACDDPWAPAPICASCRASCGKGLTALDMPVCRKEAGPRIVPRQDIDPDQEKPTSACREQAFEVTISPPSCMTARERSDRYPEMKRTDRAR